VIVLAGGFAQSHCQLPALDFVQHPDPAIKPTESKEEWMAKARLIQQTPAWN
jgi:hypothetical protein